jgi:superfamily II DNA or RNA helicase
MSLNKKQQEAFDAIVKDGKNVFVTSGPGYGKSYLAAR